MSVPELLKWLRETVPAHILRFVAGGIALGLMLMLFLKVIDVVFDLSPKMLTLFAVPGAFAFAGILCRNSRKFSEGCVNFVAGSIVIFSVGLTSNNVIAGMRDNLGLGAVAAPVGPPPAPVPPLGVIISNSDSQGG